MTNDSGARHFTIVPRGPFSLEESARFGFGQRDAVEFDGVFRLAFCVDGEGYSRQVGVAIRQEPDESLDCEVVGDADIDAVRAQVARVLSLDHNAGELLALGDRDPVMARLLAAAPGLRPPLFYSPYEAAAWCVLSARRPAAQMAEVRRRLSDAHGRVFEIAGRRLSALPTPAQMLDLPGFSGIPELKMHRLHDVAEAALQGRLDCTRLKAMAPSEAMQSLQQLEGIGPFYSALIVIRSLGHADILPENEPKGLEMAGKLYGLGRSATPEELRELSERWRPFRTWAVVLLRVAGPRVLEAS